MTWEQRYSKELSAQAAESERHAEEEQRGRDEAARREKLGYSLARQIDDQIISRFLRSAASRAGTAAAKVYERRKFGLVTIWQWTIPIKPSGNPKEVRDHVMFAGKDPSDPYYLSRTEELFVRSDATWHYTLRRYSYDDRYGDLVIHLGCDNGKIIATPLTERGDLLFTAIEDCVIAFMARHQIEPK